MQTSQMPKQHWAAVLSGHKPTALACQYCITHTHHLILDDTSQGCLDLPNMYSYLNSVSADVLFVAEITNIFFPTLTQVYIQQQSY
jgi:hypothetical protein